MKKKDNVKLQPVTVNGLEFSNISSEAYREYTFNGGETIRVENPLYVNVSKSGGHRILISNTETVYIPPTWLSLNWAVKKGFAPVQF